MSRLDNSGTRQAIVNLRALPPARPMTASFEVGELPLANHVAHIAFCRALFLDRIAHSSIDVGYFERADTSCRRQKAMGGLGSGVSRGWLLAC